MIFNPFTIQVFSLCKPKVAPKETWSLLLLRPILQLNWNISSPVTPTKDFFSVSPEDATLGHTFGKKSHFIVHSIINRVQIWLAKEQKCLQNK